MGEKKLTNRKIMLCILAVYWIAAAIFYFAAGEGIYQGVDGTNMMSAKSITPIIKQADTLSQRFHCETDTIDSIQLYGVSYGRHNTDILTLCLVDDLGRAVIAQTLDTAEIEGDGIWEIPFEEPLQDTKGKDFVLRITSAGGSEADGVSFYYGDSVSTSKIDAQVQLDDALCLQINGEKIAAQLCFSAIGTNYFLMGRYYWPSILIFGVLLAVYFLWVSYREKHCMHSRCLDIFDGCQKYAFLMRQLVSRDFKAKYKRSMLGIVWSFLNPLLTMMVQYVVFSTIFQSDIPFFPAYLLSGIIMFTYFGEVTSMCLTSITGNAGLITKVYVPKVIYPISRTVSSTVNLFISLIPLLLVALLTRTPMTKALLMIPFVTICAFMLSLGIGLLLSVLMVFFRDMQFLWSVINMMWMYATPIFYPESIIPSRFITVFKMNPLYHIVRAFRTILINGTSPEPKALLYCVIASVVPLVIGIWVFRKSQDKFILYI